VPNVDQTYINDFEEPDDMVEIYDSSSESSEEDLENIN
jgi:hypothetical protein